MRAGEDARLRRTASRDAGRGAARRGGSCSPPPVRRDPGHQPPSAPNGRASATDAEPPPRLKVTGPALSMSEGSENQPPRSLAVKGGPLPSPVLRPRQGTPARPAPPQPPGPPPPARADRYPGPGDRGPRRRRRLNPAGVTLLGPAGDPESQGNPAKARPTACGVSPVAKVSPET